jgi:hypothetical protein
MQVLGIAARIFGVDIALFTEYMEQVTDFTGQKLLKVEDCVSGVLGATAARKVSSSFSDNNIGVVTAQIEAVSHSPDVEAVSQEPLPELMEGDALNELLSAVKELELDTSKIETTQYCNGLYRHSVTRPTALLPDNVMWLCECHRNLLQEWNDGKINEKQLLERVEDLQAGEAVSSLSPVQQPAPALSTPDPFTFGLRWRLTSSDPIEIAAVPVKKRYRDILGNRWHDRCMVVFKGTLYYAHTEGELLDLVKSCLESCAPRRPSRVIELKDCSVENLGTDQTDSTRREFKLFTPQVMMQGSKKAFISSIFAQGCKRRELLWSTSNKTIMETIKRCCQHVALVGMKPQPQLLESRACCSLSFGSWSRTAFVGSKKSCAVGPTLDQRRVEEAATNNWRLQDVILFGDEHHLTILVFVFVLSLRGANSVRRLTAAAVSLQESSAGDREVIVRRIQQVSAHKCRLAVVRYSPPANPMLTQAARQGGRSVRAAAGNVCSRPNTQRAQQHAQFAGA